MPERLICTDCGHIWDRDVLATRDAARCIFCSGRLVPEAPQAVERPAEALSAETPRL